LRFVFGVALARALEAWRTPFPFSAALPEEGCVPLLAAAAFASGFSRQSTRIFPID
jgi:hypothetical protein